VTVQTKRTPDTILRILAVTEQRLQSLIDPSDGRCGIATEHKEAVRGFVDTWVLYNLQTIRQWAQGDIGARDIERLRGIL
jgi:hypothetical protein